MGATFWGGEAQDGPCLVEIVQYSAASIMINQLHSAQANIFVAKDARLQSKYSLTLSLEALGEPTT